MTELPEKTKKQLIEYFFAHLEHNSRGMTKWETDFIDSIKDQWDTKGTLSEKQYETLERIYAERT